MDEERGKQGELQDSRRRQLASLSGMNLCSRLHIIETDKSTQPRKRKGLAIWDMQLTEKIRVSVHLWATGKPRRHCLVLDDENVLIPSLFLRLITAELLKTEALLSAELFFSLSCQQ